MATRRHPIEAQIVLLAGAKASVTLSHLSALAARTHGYLRDHRDEYDRRFERLDGPEGLSYYLAEPGHWEAVGDALDLADREVDAVRRLHEEQFRRTGRRLERSGEFETTVEIRDPVAMGSRSARSSR